MKGQSKSSVCVCYTVTGRSKSSVCVTGRGLEAGEGASQASGGCNQADSRNHTSSSPGAGLNPRQETPQGGASAGGQSCSQVVHSGSTSTLSTGDSTTGV